MRRGGLRSPRGRGSRQRAGRSGGVAQGRMVHERPDGSEPEVSSTRGVAALGLEVIEEGEDHRRIEICECQCGGSPFCALLGKVEKELESVAVTRNGVGADATLCEKASLEEVLQKGWKSDLGRAGSHGPISCSPRANRSKRWEVMAISSGTAERYQYVPVTLACPR